MKLSCDPRHERRFSRSSTLCFYNLHAEWRKSCTGQTENILVLIFQRRYHTERVHIPGKASHCYNVPKHNNLNVSLSTN